MKNLILIFGLLSISCSCTAQHIALSNKATIGFPKKLRKADGKDISKLVTKRYALTKSKINESLSGLVQRNPDKVYLVDDIVVFVNSGKAQKEKGLLKYTKLASDETGLKIKGYSSKIEKIGDKDVFIVDEISEGVKLYRFTVANRAEDFVVVGFVQYMTGDELKARKVLEDLIKGLTFDD